MRHDGKAVQKVTDWSSLAPPLHVPNGGTLEVLVCNYQNIKTLGDHFTVKAQPPLVGSVGRGARVDVLVVNSFNVVVSGDLEIAPNEHGGWGEAPLQRAHKPEEEANVHKNPADGDRPVEGFTQIHGPVFVTYCDAAFKDIFEVFLKCYKNALGSDWVPQLLDLGSAGAGGLHCQRTSAPPVSLAQLSQGSALSPPGVPLVLAKGLADELEGGRDVFRIDADAFLLHNPLPEMRDRYSTADIVSSIDCVHTTPGYCRWYVDEAFKQRHGDKDPLAEVGFMLNTGFAYFRSTPQTVRLARDAEQALRTGVSSKMQTALNEELAHRHCAWSTRHGPLRPGEVRSLVHAEVFFAECDDGLRVVVLPYNVVTRSEHDMTGKLAFHPGGSRKYKMAVLPQVKLMCGGQEVQPQEVWRLWDELGGSRGEEVEVEATEEEVPSHRSNVAPEDVWLPEATVDVVQGDAGAEVPPMAAANLSTELLASAGEAERAALQAARVAQHSKSGTHDKDARDARRQWIREQKPRGPSRVHGNRAHSLVPTLAHGPVGDGARISLSIRHSANVLLATAGSDLSIDGANLVAPALRVQAPLRRNQVSVVLKDSANVLSRHGSSVQVVNGGVLVGPLMLTEEAPIWDSHISVALSNVGTVHGTDVRVHGGSRLVEAAVACGKVQHSSLIARVTSTANVNASLGGHVEIAGRSSLLSTVISASAIYSDREIREGALTEEILESRFGTIQNSDAKVRLVDSASIFLVGALTTIDSMLLGPITEDNLTLATIDLTLKNTAVVKGRSHRVTTTNTTLCADGAAVLQRAADKFANTCTLNVVHGKPLLERQASYVVSRHQDVKPESPRTGTDLP